MKKRKRSAGDANTSAVPKKRRKPNKARAMIQAMDVKEARNTLLELSYEKPELQQVILDMAPKTDVGKAIDRLSTIGRKATRAGTSRWGFGGAWSYKKVMPFVPKFKKEIVSTVNNMIKKKEYQGVKEYLGKVDNAIDLFPTNINISKGREDVSLRSEIEKPIKTSYTKLLKVKKLGFTEVDFEGIIEDLECFGFQEELTTVVENLIKKL